MKTGINADFIARKVGMKNAAKYITDAGFKYVDYTPPLKESNWEEIMKEDFDILKSNGLTVHQTHAPFNRYGSYGDKHILCMDRCMEATAYMGAEYIAVHGDEFDFENMEFSEEAALNYNHNYFVPYVEKAGKMGFKMAFETVFEENSRGRRRYTSNPEDLLKLILSFNSENAVCCWDFGHANVQFPKTAPEWIEKFGSLIKCTHLHDNAGNDSHQMPTTGDINWEKTMHAFKNAGYNGVLSVEYAHGNVPEIYLPEFLKLTNKITEYLYSL